MESLLTREASLRYEAGDYTAALELYERLSKQVSASAWQADIRRVRREMERRGPEAEAPLRVALQQCLGIEKVYFVNLARRPDRALRQLRELNAHGVVATRLRAVDARTSQEAERLKNDFKVRPVDAERKSSRHLEKRTLGEYKKHLNTNVFAYLLSQAKALEDAKRNGYKRILILDDDVFFASNATRVIHRIGDQLPSDWKILLLGASEYADRNSEHFVQSRLKEDSVLYRPIPGKTCGSFAVAYDASIYDELLEAIHEGEGTYDNVALGSLYQKYPGACLVVDPAVCIPDVSDSDIRSNARDQECHGRKMNWEFNRYPTFAAPLTISVVLRDLVCLRHVESLRYKGRSNTFIRLYYPSRDGLRPVIPGQVFRVPGAEVVPLSVKGGPDLAKFAREARIPRSDVVLVWPDEQALDDQEILNAAAECMAYANFKGRRHGTVRDMPFCLGEGVMPSAGRHSVIIPSFRTPDHTWATVESALRQTAQDLEVIVVNDNPENRGFKEELLARYDALLKREDLHVTAKLVVIEHEINRNASAARNTGFLASTGTYISFLDDDDRFEPGRLAAVEAVLADTAADVGAAYCGYTGAWNGERNMQRFPSGDLGPHVMQLRYGEHYMCTNTVTFKRAALERIGGCNESYRRHQDLELMTRFFREFTIVAVPEFHVQNRPAAAPETFVASIEKLCELKHQFLRDFRADIHARGQEFLDAVIAAHALDISKRDKKIAPGTVSTIDAFLRSAVRV